MNIDKLFDRYNLKYFDGALSSYKLIVSNKFGAQGMCRRTQREIHINEGLTGLTRRQTLIHEMAHAVAKDRNHGPVWIAEMRRLLSLGAPTGFDIRMYTNPAGTSDTRELVSQAEDAGQELGDASKWIDYKNGECYRNGLVDKHGRAESPHARRLIRKLRAGFLRGVRDRIEYDEARAKLTEAL